MADPAPRANTRKRIQTRAPIQIQQAFQYARRPGATDFEQSYVKTLVENLSASINHQEEQIAISDALTDEHLALLKSTFPGYVFLPSLVPDNHSVADAFRLGMEKTIIHHLRTLPPCRIVLIGPSDKQIHDFRNALPESEILINQPTLSARDVARFSQTRPQVDRTPFQFDRRKADIAISFFALHDLHAADVLATCIYRGIHTLYNVMHVAPQLLCVQQYRDAATGMHYSMRDNNLTCIFREGTNGYSHNAYNAMSWVGAVPAIGGYSFISETIARLGALSALKVRIVEGEHELIPFQPFLEMDTHLLLQSTLAISSAGRGHHFFVDQIVFDKTVQFLLRQPPKDRTIETAHAKLATLMFSVRIGEETIQKKWSAPLEEIESIAVHAVMYASFIEEERGLIMDRMAAERQTRLGWLADSLTSRIVTAAGVTSGYLVSKALGKGRYERMLDTFLASRKAGKDCYTAALEDNFIFRTEIAPVRSFIYQAKYGIAVPTGLNVQLHLTRSRVIAQDQASAFAHAAFRFALTAAAAPSACLGGHTAGHYLRLAAAALENGIRDGPQGIWTARYHTLLLDLQGDINSVINGLTNLRYPSAINEIEALGGLYQICAGALYELVGQLIEFLQRLGWTSISYALNKLRALYALLKAFLIAQNIIVGERRDIPSIRRFRPDSDDSDDDDDDFVEAQGMLVREQEIPLVEAVEAVDSPAALLAAAQAVRRTIAPTIPPLHADGLSPLADFEAQRGRARLIDRIAHAPLASTIPHRENGANNTSASEAESDDEIAPLTYSEPPRRQYLRAPTRIEGTLAPVIATDTSSDDESDSPDEKNEDLSEDFDTRTLDPICSASNFQPPFNRLAYSIAQQLYERATEHCYDEDGVPDDAAIDDAVIELIEELREKTAELQEESLEAQLEGVRNPKQAVWDRDFRANTTVARPMFETPPPRDFDPASVKRWNSIAEIPPGVMTVLDRTVAPQLTDVLCQRTNVYASTLPPVSLTVGPHTIGIALYRALHTSRPIISDEQIEELYARFDDIYRDDARASVFDRIFRQSYEYDMQHGRPVFRLPNVILDGLAASAKSKTVARFLRRGDAIVVPTRDLKHKWEADLSDLGITFVKVFTQHVLLRPHHQDTQFKTLYIDEALNLSELLCLRLNTRAITSVWLGDSSQIPDLGFNRAPAVIDPEQYHGICSVISAPFSFAMPTDVLLTLKRIGAIDVHSITGGTEQPTLFRGTATDDNAIEFLQKDKRNGTAHESQGQRLHSTQVIGRVRAARFLQFQDGQDLAHFYVAISRHTHCCILDLDHETALELRQALRIVDGFDSIEFDYFAPRTRIALDDKMRTNVDTIQEAQKYVESVKIVQLRAENFDTQDRTTERVLPAAPAYAELCQALVSISGNTAQIEYNELIGDQHMHYPQGAKQAFRFDLIEPAKLNTRTCSLPPVGIPFSSRDHRTTLHTILDRVICLPNKLRADQVEISQSLHAAFHEAFIKTDVEAPPAPADIGFMDWVHSRTASYTADRFIFGETARSVSFQGFLKTHAKMKSQPGFGLSAEYGQTISAGTQAYNARFTHYARTLTLQLQRRLRDNIILDIGYSEARFSDCARAIGMYSVDNTTIDVKRQDSCHTEADVLLLIRLCIEYAGMTAEDASLYYDMRREFQVFYRSSPTQKASYKTSWMLPSGDPFTLLANCLQESANIAFAFEFSPAPTGCIKGDDTYWVGSHHPSIRGAIHLAQQGVVLKIAHNEPPQFCTRLFLPSGQISYDFVKAAGKYTSKRAAPALYREYCEAIEKNFPLLDDNDEQHLIAAVAHLHPHIPSDNLATLYSFVLNLRKKDYFARFQRPDMYLDVIDSPTDCIFNCVQAIRGTECARKYRNRSKAEVTALMRGDRIHYQIQEHRWAAIKAARRNPEIIMLLPAHAIVAVYKQREIGGVINSVKNRTRQERLLDSHTQD